jgi:hypothetical protein
VTDPTDREQLDQHDCDGDNQRGANSESRNGSVWPMPPIAVIPPSMIPRADGCPRPVNEPSSDSASANPMLIPAQTDAASPTRNASRLWRVASAAANTDASVDTDPSLNRLAWAALPAGRTAGDGLDPLHLVRRPSGAHVPPHPPAARGSALPAPDHRATDGSADRWCAPPRARRNDDCRLPPPPPGAGLHRGPNSRINRAFGAHRSPPRSQSHSACDAA